jgi:uncharacterized membrane protein YraQ (UPF0718 family)
VTGSTVAAGSETTGTARRSRAAAAIARRELLLALKLAAGALAWSAAYRALPEAAAWLTYSVLGLSRGSRLGESVVFFLYDVPKILLLLVAMIFGIGIVRTFFSPERARTLLGGRRQGVGNVLAAGLGVVTPFCSCSAVPLFIGFVESGIPLGVTFSFLVAAPTINEVAVVLLYGMFGWRVAGLYISAGLAIAIVTGIVIGRLRLERYVEDFVWQVHVGEGPSPERPTWTDRVARASMSVREIVGKIWLYVVAGIAVGSVIHGYVPENALTGVMGQRAWWSVPAAVLLGVPLYSNAAAMLPVVGALVSKGASVGAALAFMMAVVGLSLPETIILRRVLKPPLIVVFIVVVACAIVLIGWLFNVVF